MAQANPALFNCSLLTSDILSELNACGELLQSSPILSPQNLLITTDSRIVGAGHVFIAYKGVTSDGHKYIDSAIERGCRVFVIEDENIFAKLGNNPSLTFFLVRSSRRAWSFLCARAFDHPERKIPFIGVTGTNGKTSTVWMVKSLLESLGKKVATIGTLGTYIGDEHIPTHHTTPDPHELYAVIAKAVAEGCHTIVMEATSIAVDQEKLGPIRFAAMGFTSFTRDHLDHHGTMENYLAAKWRLFTAHLNGRAVFWQGLPEQVLKLVPSLNAESWGYEVGSTRIAAKHIVRISRIRANRNGSDVDFDFDGTKFSGTIPFWPGYLVENFLCALTLAHALDPGVLRGDILSHIAQVPGRLERVRSTTKGDDLAPIVLVDYAHTHDAIEALIKSVRQQCRGHLILVLGCGGDRDRGKRPMMAASAEAGADIIVLTSDNPRTEDPDKIIDDMVVGLKNRNRVLIQVDRAKAIRMAIARALPSDIVVIAGKGHEDYQTVGKENFPFDDRIESRKALDETVTSMVIGGGVSGQGAAALLKSYGHHVIVSDRGPLSAEAKEKLREHEVIEGAQEPHLLAPVNGVVVLSPGVSSKLPLVAAAKSHRTISEIDLGLSGFQGKRIGVTGTNGKSTVTMMIEHILNASGVSARSAGNIGTPPSLLAAQGTRDKQDCLVLELSSYQTEQSHDMNVDVALFTSFSHDHMTRHGSLEGYFAAKWRLISQIKDGGCLIMTDEVKAFAKQFGVTIPPGINEIIVPRSVRQELVTSNLPLLGQHNVLNAVMALRAVEHVTQRNVDDLAKHLKNFKGLPYRCEIVGKIIGDAGEQLVVNDSKSTNVESTLVAIHAAYSHTNKKVFLLMGGQGKDEPYSPLNEVKDKIACLWTFGASGTQIHDQCAAFIQREQLRNFATLRECLNVVKVEIVGRRSEPLLFSPGCASFDEFKNYEHRGREFNAALSATMKT